MSRTPKEPEYDEWDGWNDLLAEFRALRFDASRHGSNSTGRKYARLVDKWACWLSDERDTHIWDATNVDLRAWLKELKRADYSVSHRRNYSKAVSVFFKDIEDMVEEREEYAFPLPDEAPPNPRANLKERHRNTYLKGDSNKSQSDVIDERGGVYYLEHEDIDRMLENLPSPRWRNELMLKLQYKTGLRAGELVSIKIAHIDENERSITVPAQKSEKRTVYYGGKNPRWVELPLKRWLDGGRVGENEEYLFPSERADHVSTTSYGRHVVKKAAENAGIQQEIGEYADGRTQSLVTSHAIRHSYGVQAIRSGIDVRNLMRLMGHTELDMTLRYLKIADSDTKKAAKKFDRKDTF
jgi:integrase/recombinase XerD